MKTINLYRNADRPVLLHSFVDTLNCRWFVGQAFVFNEDAYVIAAIGTSTAEDTDEIHLDLMLDEQPTCDDCGMAKIEPSDRPLCICAESEEIVDA